MNNPHGSGLFDNSWLKYAQQGSRGSYYWLKQTMNPNLIPDGPLLAAAVEKLLKYQASVDQTLQPSINQQLGGQSRFFMARGAIDVCYTVTGVDDCYTAKETLRDIINDQDSGLAFQLRESCLGIQCAHLIENNYQWACPKKKKSQTFLRRAITPAPAPAPLLSPAPLPQPSLGPANVPAPASNLPAAASNLPGPAPNLLAPASIPHKDTGPAPHLLGPYWQDGPTALPSTAPQPLTTSELKQTPTVAPSSHVILPTLPKPVSEASSPGTPHGLEPQASQPMFSLPRSAVPEKLPLPVLLHRPQAPLPSPEQKTEDRPTLSPEPITGPSYDQAAGPQNQSKIQPSPDQAISYTGQHAPMSAHWQQLIRPSAPALPTLQQSQDSISIPTSSYSESPRSAIEPSSSPIGLPGLQDHQLDLSSAQSQPQVDQQHVAPHETVQAPSILPTTLPPVDLPVIPQETIQPPARPHDILVQPLDMPNEVANAESPSAPEETSAGSQQTSQTPLLDVNPTPTPVALRPSIAQPLDPPVLPDSNSLAQDLLSAPVIFPSPALPEEQLGPPIEYPPVQQVSPDPPPFEHPPVQPVSPDPTPSPILSLTPSPTPSPSPIVLQTSPPPSIPSPIASPPPPSLPPPPRLEEAENQSSTSSEGTVESDNA